MEFHGALGVHCSVYCKKSFFTMAARRGTMDKMRAVLTENRVVLPDGGFMGGINFMGFMGVIERVR